MSNSKSSFWSIYCSHVKLNNHYAFITIDTHAILPNIDISLSQSIFTKITYTQLFIFQNKLTFTGEVALATCCFN